MAQIDLGYRPRPQFVPFHKRDQRWAALVCHRRAGKTVACIMDLVDAALRSTKDNARFAYVAPFYAQAKDVAWSYIKKFCAPIPGAEPNEGELRVDFAHNGARIRLYGADNYDRMRGIYLDGVILDEAADFDPRAWPEVIRPALSDRQGWATFIGTPKGRNAFFETYSKAVSDPSWFSLMLRASETGIVAKGELEDAQQMMTPEQYAQEFECSFDAAIIGSYFGKEIADAERAGRVTSVPYDPSIPVHTAFDLGIGDSTAIWFFQIAPGELRVIDYYENSGQNLAHYVQELQSRPYKYGHDYLPHDAKIRSLETGRTRVETLLQLGRKPRMAPEVSLEDGINAVRVSFPKIWIDENKCKFGLEALRQYRTEFDEKAKVFRNKPKHDWTSHAADSFRYLCLAWRELVAPKEKVRAPINTRPPTLNEMVAYHDRHAAGGKTKRI